ncbi:TNF receptor-associated factor 3-like isoform X1 [Dysidea avara]|uniref:TNF receptor-associated factor 3-like isoform X1 n=1 Tax=Dysidea avara TaxID=196820 RepID=UPI00333152D7
MAGGPTSTQITWNSKMELECWVAMYQTITADSDVGGYDYQFLETPSDNLVCKICHYPSKVPYLSECCGHTFCKSCLEQANVCICPMCRSENFAVFANKQVDRAVRGLHVFCTNKEKGCQWQGEVNDIINHLGNSNGCQFEEVVCPNDCGTTFKRHCLATHVKRKCPRHKVNCQYCHIEGERQFVRGEHKEQCPKFSIACPNKCEVGSVPRDNIAEHMKMCSLEIIQCEFHVVGCGDCIARKDQKKHNEQNMEKHLSLSVHQLTSTQDNIAYWAVDSREELVGKIMQTEESVVNTQRNVTMATRRLQRVEIDLATTKRQLVQRATSNEAEVNTVREEMNTKFMQMTNFIMAKERSVGASKKVYCRRVFCLCFFTVLIVFLGYMALFIYESKRTAVTAEGYHGQNFTDCECQDVNQLTQELMNTQAKIIQVEAAAQKNITELEKKLQLLSELYEEVYVHNNTQQTVTINGDVKWTAKLIIESAKLSSGNQIIPIIVKLSEYSKKYHDDVDWFSVPFYTHPNGYRLCLNINAAGKNLAYSTHLSVELYLMKGPYDNYLTWPLSENCKVKLLNQISNSEHYSNLMSYDSNGCNRVTYGERNHNYIRSNLKYISNRDLYKATSTRQYLRDDAIYFYVDCEIYSV